MVFVFLIQLWGRQITALSLDPTAERKFHLLTVSEAAQDSGESSCFGLSHQAAVIVLWAGHAGAGSQRDSVARPWEGP